jgi:F-type H+-transporting ATPase subunit a
MSAERFKSLLVAGFSVFLACFFHSAVAQTDSLPKQEKKGFDAKEIIFGHVLNNHDFHILDIVHDDGHKRRISIPLPVILYSKQRGLDVFMSSRFHHGEESYHNYLMLTNEKIEELKLDPAKYSAQDIVALNENGEIDPLSGFMICRLPEMWFKC